MARIYLIRHGKPETLWNQGDADPGLDETGRAQAAAAADRLSALPEGERPRVVISSPLRRCRETADVFARLMGRDVEIDPGVGEIPTPASLLPEDRPQWLRKAFSGRWDQIEGDLDYVLWRDAVVQAVRARPGCAVFSHFVAINAVVSSLLGMDEALAFQPDYASVTVLDLTDGRLSLIEKGREAVTRVL